MRCGSSFCYRGNAEGVFEVTLTYNKVEMRRRLPGGIYCILEVFMGNHNMKKILIIFINVIIMAAILTFVVIYSGLESRDSYRRQIENFENTTVAMKKVTENYLEGEQRICDVWARYIKNNKMTMEEASEYVRSTHVLANASAHLIFVDTLKGISTRPKQGTADDYAVSYERIGLLDNIIIC